MAGDPNFSAVVLLLHGDGTNGSTTITDVTGKTVTRIGNVQISTAQSKFGGASIAYDASGDGLSVAGSSAFAFGTGDFTMEMWVYLSSANVALLSRWTSQWWFGVDASSRLAFYPQSNIFTPFTTATVPQNQWVHVAITRASGTIRLFINGTKGYEGSGFSQDYTNTSATLYVGSQDGTTTNEVTNGYLDDVRITKGVARYTANFTPPTAAFPDYQYIDEPHALNQAWELSTYTYDTYRLNQAWELSCYVYDTYPLGQAWSLAGYTTQTYLLSQQWVLGVVDSIGYTDSNYALNGLTTLNSSDGPFWALDAYANVNAPTTEWFALNAYQAVNAGDYSYFAQSSYQILLGEADNGYGLAGLSVIHSMADSRFALEAYTSLQAEANSGYALTSYAELSGVTHAHYALEPIGLAQSVAESSYALQSYSLITGQTHADYGVTSVASIAGVTNSDYVIGSFGTIQGQTDSVFFLPVTAHLEANTNADYGLSALVDAQAETNVSYGIQLYVNVSAVQNSDYGLLADILLSGLADSVYALAPVAQVTGYTESAFSLHVFAPIKGQAHAGYQVASVQSVSATQESSYALNTWSVLYGQAQAEYSLTSLTLVYGATEVRYGITAGEAFSSWAINLQTGAVSKYEQYNFTSFAFDGTRTLATGEDGIYVLDGDDDNGTDIAALVDIGPQTFGSPYLKRIPFAYLGLKNDEGMQLVQETDDGTTSTQNLDYSGTLQLRKLNLPRGQMGNYHRFTLKNLHGADFTLDSIELIPEVTTRRRTGSHT